MMLKTAFALLVGTFICTVGVVHAQTTRDVATLSEQMKQFTVKVYARPNPEKPDGWTTC